MQGEPATTLDRWLPLVTVLLFFVLIGLFVYVGLTQGPNRV